MTTFAYFCIFIMWLTWEWSQGRLGLLGGAISGKYAISGNDYKGLLSNQTKAPNT